MTLRALRDAFGYFSIFPVAARRPLGPASLAYVPLVGIATGALSGAAALAVETAGSRPLAIAAAFGAPIVLTGAIHVDGFLDASDALFASVPPAQRYEIMHDPHHGTYAIASFAVLSATSCAALASLPAPAYPFALAFAGAVSRTAALLNAYTLPYPPRGSATRAFTRPPHPGPIVVAMLAGMSCGLAVDRRAGWLAAGIVTAGYAGGRLCARRLGGYLSGDAYGFLISVLETLALSGLAALAGA